MMIIKSWKSPDGQYVKTQRGEDGVEEKKKKEIGVERNSVGAIEI